MLPDQKAKLIPKPRLATGQTVRGMRPIRGRRNGGRSRRARERTQLLDRAKADPIGLPESSVNSPSFGDTHFGAPHHGRNVRRIGIAVADKTFRAKPFIDDCFKNPTIESWITAMIYQRGSYPSTSSAAGYPKQTRVRDVPDATEQLEVSRGD